MFGRRRTRRAPSDGEVGSLFHDLRRQVLDLDPASVGLTPQPERPDVWGGLMDMGYPGQRWASLVVVGDGTVSLYTSSGGGVIGAGAHASVAAAAQSWLNLLQRRLDTLTATGDVVLPAPRRVTIRALTFAGRRAIEADENLLGSGQAPGSDLFYAAHDVLTQVRLIEESRSQDTP